MHDPGCASLRPGYNVIARNGEGTYCSVERRFPPCGPEGKLWERA